MHLERMILLETETGVNGFDFHILSIIGIYITLLLKPLKANFIENIHIKMLEENEQSHNKIIYKAEKLIKNRSTSKRAKTYIERVFNDYKDEYEPSVWVRSISGISSICLGFCVFLLIAVFTYSIINLDFIVTSVVFSSLLTLAATIVFVRLVAKAGFNPECTYSFNFLSLIYGLIPIIAGIFVGIIIAIVTHFKQIPIPEIIVKTLFYSSFWIPFIPIFIAFISTARVYRKKFKSCSLLEKTLKDYDSDQLKLTLQRIDEELKAAH